MVFKLGIYKFKWREPDRFVSVTRSINYSCVNYECGRKTHLKNRRVVYGIQSIPCDLTIKGRSFCRLEFVLRPKGTNRMDGARMGTKLRGVGWGADERIIVNYSNVASSLSSCAYQNVHLLLPRNLYTIYWRCLANKWEVVGSRVEIYGMVS